MNEKQEERVEEIAQDAIAKLEGMRELSIGDFYRALRAMCSMIEERIGLAGAYGVDLSEL